MAYLNNRYGRLRDIAVGPNQEIYLATNGNSWANTDPYTHLIVRIQPPTQPPAGTTDEDATGYRPDQRSAWLFYPQPLQGEWMYFRPALGNQGLAGDLEPSRLNLYDGLGRLMATLPVEQSVDEATYRVCLPDHLRNPGTPLVASLLNARGVVLTQHVLFR
jgi:hypothetical protein